ncbi:tRNA (uracil-5-)-methyltransferase homolog B-like [Haemaphysalis longicornis]
MSALHELAMLKSAQRSFVGTHARTTVRWLRAAVRRVVPVIEDTAAPAASVPPREPAAKQDQPPRRVDDEREKAEARRLKLREKYRVDDDNKYEKLAMVVTPLWKYPYKKQLLFKYEDLQKCLQKLGKRLRQANATFPPDPHGLPCPLRPVLPSPVVEGYRNKDEFSVRQGPRGEPKTVGFLVGSPADLDRVVCVSPEHVVVCKESHKQVAKSFQEYIRRSPLEGCYETQFRGHWKQLVVRSNSRGHLMAIVVMHPQQLTPEELSREKAGLLEHFVHGPGSACNLSSLYFQACPHSRCTHAQAPFELLHGQPHLEEQLGSLRFRISPESFFQVNSPVATYLYDAVRQLLNPGPQGSLLDVCCGTGTIGLTLARQLHTVLGMDVSAQAIEDATHNAQLNGISNARYQVGRAELLLPELRGQFFADDLCAVVNPGRAGLSARAIRALREYGHIKRLVYISCQPEGAAMDNFVELCSNLPKARKVGAPFRLLLACPVDMFPQTRHCELLLLFGR